MSTPNPWTDDSSNPWDSSNWVSPCPPENHSCPSHGGSHSVSPIPLPYTPGSSTSSPSGLAATPQSSQGGTNASTSDLGTPAAGSGPGAGPSNSSAPSNPVQGAGSDSEDGEDMGDTERNKGVSEKDIAKRVMGEYDREKLSTLPTPMDIARKITTKILRVPDITFSDSLSPEVNEVLLQAATNHGLLDLTDPKMLEGISAFPFVRAVALLHHVCIKPATLDIPASYKICVRAVNTLKLILDPDYAKKLNPAVVTILQKVWDISVLLLGATRTRAHLVGDNHMELDDLNFRHATHYRAAVEKVIKGRLNEWSVCARAIADLTREEMPPFIRPQEILDYMRDLDVGHDMFHRGCTAQHCKPDVDGQKQDPYHIDCDGSCQSIIPHKSSLSEFNSILESQRRMPAIKANAYQDRTAEGAKNYWVPTTRRTLAISHLWRDGIAGTRDDGMSECLHRHFSKLALDNGLDSYWIDCATIPEDPRKRRMMIALINSTFNTASFTLCMDRRIAKIKLPEDNISTNNHYKEKVLLAIVTSFWHRRAWTLLEGHKSTEIYFYREDGKHINLKETLMSVLGVGRDEASTGGESVGKKVTVGIPMPTTTPLWIRACLAEFEAYMTDSLTPEAAGILLITRAASREGDAEVIWRLLTQPYTSHKVSQKLAPHPFYFADTADLAFLCSNADRSNTPGLCWMPAKTQTSAWARQALGGAKAEIIRTTNVHLRSKWYVKYGRHQDIATIEWGSSVSNKLAEDHLEWKLESRTFQFIMALPVLAEDQERPEPSDRIIILTRPSHQHLTFGQNLLEPLWHWETMVKLKKENIMSFKPEDIQTLEIGFENLPPTSSAASRVSQGQSLLALQASMEIARSTNNPLAEANRRLKSWRVTDFLAKAPLSMAWAILFVMYARVATGTALLSSTNGQSTTQDQRDVSIGTLDTPSWIHLPQNIHPILVEWAALIPLTVYLANGRSDFELAAEVSLRGSLSVGVIPKLFALGGIAKILRQGEVFFDSANAAGETLKVFDVQHGCVFRCYNSGAAAAIAEAAFTGGAEGDPEILEEHLVAWIDKNKEKLEQDFALAQYTEIEEGPSAFRKLRDNRKIYGRRQILNVIDVQRQGSYASSGQAPINASRSMGRPRWLWIPEFILTAGGAGVLASTGCMGCAALLLIGAVSRICAFKTKIGRPPTFLQNRESYEGCMLVAIHDNAAVWTLYRGERGLIDSVLNKPMVAHFRPTKISNFVHGWFRFAEVLQVVAMTYVAGEKGWDGLMLFILITVAWVLGKLLGYNRHAQNFLRDQGCRVTAFGCEFPGRTELLGAVQLLSTQGKTLWMDSIIAPCDRRAVLLEKLLRDREVKADPEVTARLRASFNQLSPTDKKWVLCTWIQSKAGATLIKEKLADRSGRGNDGIVL